MGRRATGPDAACDQWKHLCNQRIDKIENTVSPFIEDTVASASLGVWSIEVFGHHVEIQSDAVCDACGADNSLCFRIKLGHFLTLFYK